MQAIGRRCIASNPSTRLVPRPSATEFAVSLPLQKFVLAIPIGELRSNEKKRPSHWVTNFLTKNSVLYQGELQTELVQAVSQSDTHENNEDAADLR